ncbi:MAG: prolyl 4-hydroxylase [Sphingomonadales bacterium]|nr:prolyl 4-hydroxylase [Sphingomonadales bacterium]
MGLDVGDSLAEAGDDRRRPSVVIGAPAQKIDADVDRLDLRPRLQRVVDGAEGGEFEQPGNRPAVEETGTADHLFPERHDPEALAVALLGGEAKQFGIRGEGFQHRHRLSRAGCVCKAARQAAWLRPMSESLFDAAAARLRAGDGVAARELFRRAAAAGERRAAVIYTHLVGAGVGGPADWPRAVDLLRGLAASGRRSAVELALVETMALRPDGSPLSVPAPEPLAERPRILSFRGLFTPGECRYLIDAAAPMLAAAVVIDPVTGRQRPDPLRSAESVGFTPPLETLAVQALNRRIAAASGTSFDQGEPLQVLRYPTGGEYRPHCDAISGFANQRVLTMLVWLNDGFEGGETEFPEAGLALRGAPGDAILFRNTGADGRRDPASAHAGLPVKAGEKWLASRWIRERPYVPPLP